MGYASTVADYHRERNDQCNARDCARANAGDQGSDSEEDGGQPPCVTASEANRVLRESFQRTVGRRRREEQGYPDEGEEE